jgi:prepilin-type N-terminal cleavage/methylation domain-containing protein
MKASYQRRSLRPPGLQPRARTTRTCLHASCVMRHALFAFTLIEILIVIGIIGIVMTIAIPSIYRQLHPESMQKAVSDIMETCTHARAQAILSGSITEIVIHPMDRTFSVGAASAAPTEPTKRLESLDVAGNEWRMEERHATSSSSTPTEGGLSSAKISDKIQIEGIRLNFLDYTEDEVVRVRFYPNGTSDEFSIFLLSDQGERRQIFLEVVTGLADVESDPQKFR